MTTAYLDWLEQALEQPEVYHLTHAQLEAERDAYLSDRAWSGRMWLDYQTLMLARVLQPEYFGYSRQAFAHVCTAYFTCYPTHRIIL